MKAKQIKEYLDDRLDSVAPDLVEEICSKPIEPITDENELFGEDAPLYKNSFKKKLVWGSFATAVVACMIAIIVFVMPTGNQIVNTNVAAEVVIDVNPSITLEVTEDGKVVKVKAGNKDAKQIVSKVNNKLSDDDSYNTVMKNVIKELRKNGYLKKKEGTMLVSVFAEKKDVRKETTAKIKQATEEYEVSNNKKFTTIYQEAKNSKQIEKIAKKNKVSVGKAALCIKLAEAKGDDYEALCKKNINTLAKEIKKTGLVDEDDSVYIVEDVFQNGIEEITSVFEEMTSVEETLLQETTELTSESETQEETTFESVTGIDEHSTTVAGDVEKIAH